MARPTIFALFVTFFVFKNAQSTEIIGDWSEHASAFKYYPNDTLNLVTLGVINGKKYLFAKEGASWYEASYFCNAYGMDLASIETQHESDLIVEHIAKIGFDQFVLWISGHNIGTSTWLWINGEFVIFSNWEVGQPNPSDNEHCLCIFDGKWHDNFCTWTGKAWSDGGFICEERETFEFEEIEAVNDESKSRSIYPTDWFNMVTLDPTTGKQYLFAEASASWIEASYFCNAHGMDLVTIETQNENDLIMAHIESLGEYSLAVIQLAFRNNANETTPLTLDSMAQVMAYWTSAHTIGRSTWLWINGENVIFFDWATGQPSHPTTEKCMHIWEGDWFDRSCEWIETQSAEKSTFICETRELPPSNSTELTMADNYYPSDMLNLVTLGPGDGKKYLVSNQPATWFEGCYFCNAHGMDLVTIETKEENDAIVDHLDKIGYKNSYTFTSGHKIGRASYLWINGEYMLYSDWAPGQPSQEVTENCMIVWRNDWYDLPCNWTASFSSYFICEERIFLTNSNVDEFRLF